jgi:hypothetical protein
MAGTKPQSGHRRGIILQSRDLRGLRELSVMRIADRDQFMVAAGFSSITRVNTRLLALTNAGLLRRFFIGFSGARKALYALSPKGALAADVPLRGPRRPQETMLVADYFTEHQLAINRVYCQLKFRSIPVPQVRFVNWLSFHEPIVAGINLIPDGYVEFSTATGIDASFIEVDLGHESLSVWKEKARRYLELALSGKYEERFRQPRFRVLVLAHSERKLGSIREAVAEVTEKIFWFATLDAVRGDKFFGPVWVRPVGDQYQPFFKETP